eukprot:m.327956 g.327956  ORF g.327956 m.327956 type:complete len:300 (+) comp16028_c3_seq3:442-1341(+)
MSVHYMKRAEFALETSNIVGWQGAAITKLGPLHLTAKVMLDGMDAHSRRAKQGLALLYEYHFVLLVSNSAKEEETQQNYSLESLCHLSELRLEIHPDQQDVLIISCHEPPFSSASGAVSSSKPSAAKQQSGGADAATTQPSTQGDLQVDRAQEDGRSEDKEIEETKVRIQAVAGVKTESTFHVQFSSLKDARAWMHSLLLPSWRSSKSRSLQAAASRAYAITRVCPFAPLGSHQVVSAAEKDVRIARRRIFGFSSKMGFPKQAVETQDDDASAVCTCLCICHKVQGSRCSRYIGLISMS